MMPEYNVMMDIRYMRFLREINEVLSGISKELDVVLNDIVSHSMLIEEGRAGESIYPVDDKTMLRRGIKRNLNFLMSTVREIQESEI